MHSDFLVRWATASTFLKTQALNALTCSPKVLIPIKLFSISYFKMVDILITTVRLFLTTELLSTEPHSQEDRNNGKKRAKSSKWSCHRSRNRCDDWWSLGRGSWWSHRWFRWSNGR